MMENLTRRSLFLLTPLLVVGIMGGTALTQMRERHHDGPPGSAHWREERHDGKGRGQFFNRMKEQLQLSDEQVRKIRNIMIEALKKRIPVKANLKVARIELGQLMAREEVDKTKLDGKIDQIGRLRQQILSQRIDRVLEIRKILTPEQIEKAQPLLMQRFLSGRRGRS